MSMGQDQDSDFARFHSHTISQHVTARHTGNRFFPTRSQGGSSQALRPLAKRRRLHSQLHGENSEVPLHSYWKNIHRHTHPIGCSISVVVTVCQCHCREGMWRSDKLLLGNSGFRRDLIKWSHVDLSVRTDSTGNLGCLTKRRASSSCWVNHVAYNIHTWSYILMIYIYIYLWYVLSHCQKLFGCPVTGNLKWIDWQPKRCSNVVTIVMKSNAAFEDLSVSVQALSK